jgi:hypothetical protein
MVLVLVHDNLYSLEPSTHTTYINCYVNYYQPIINSVLSFFYTFRVYEIRHQEHNDLTLKLYVATQYRLND